MIPRPFEYFSPSSLSEALSLLKKYGEDAKILAGGHSLIPLMKLRLASPKYLIEINKIPNMSYIREEGGKLVIGARTTHHQVETSAVIRTKCPILAETAEVVGDPQVRNVGTIGGAIIHADPAGDYLPTMIAVGARFKAVGTGGEKSFEAEDFFQDMFTTVLAQDEILTEIVVPAPPPGTGGAYLKLERKSGDFAIVGAAVQLTLDQGKVCKKIAIGLGGVGPTVVRAREAEKVLLGKTLSEASMAEAAEIASESCNPISDIRGSSQYKKEMVNVYVKRALVKAFDRAIGNR